MSDENSDGSSVKFLSFTQSTLKLNIPPALDVRLVNKAIYLITWQLIWLLKYVITCVPLFSLIQIFPPRKSKLDYPVFYFVVVVLPIIFIGCYYRNSCGIRLLKVVQYLLLKLRINIHLVKILKR